MRQLLCKLAVHKRIVVPKTQLSNTTLLFFTRKGKKNECAPPSQFTVTFTPSLSNANEHDLLQAGSIELRKTTLKDCKLLKFYEIFNNS